MKFSEVASRLNGISTPFFGVSWTPATSDVEVVRGVILFMEGRRILYECHHTADWPFKSGIERMEKSVGEIRAFLTESLVKGGISAELAESLKIMRQATMDCLDGLERWLEFFDIWVDRPFDMARVAAQGAAVDDLKATVALFRLTMNKVMEEVAEAHRLEFHSLN